MTARARPAEAATDSAAGHPLWDLPTRVFHWTLALALPLAWWTAEESHYQWHERIGYAVIVLLLFRLAWGLWGSRHSRFADFLRIGIPMNLLSCAVSCSVIPLVWSLTL